MSTYSRVNVKISGPRSLSKKLETNPVLVCEKQFDHSTIVKKPPRSRFNLPIECSVYRVPPLIGPLNWDKYTPNRHKTYTKPPQTVSYIPSRTSDLLSKSNYPWGHELRVHRYTPDSNTRRNHEHFARLEIGSPDFRQIPTLSASYLYAKQDNDNDYIARVLVVNRQDTDIGSIGSSPSLKLNAKFELTHRVVGLSNLNRPKNISEFYSKREMSTMHPNDESNRSESGSRAPASSSSLEIDPRGGKSLKINACGQLYAKLAKKNPIAFSKAPTGRGIDFNMTYYDSLEIINDSGGIQSVDKTPTVCLLHGAPGSNQDFASLINFLTSNGVRVLAPNFPTYDVTFEHSFRHSPLERTEFLAQFFKAIKVKRIDMMIGHSSAIYTVFELLNQSLKPQSTESIESKQLEIRCVGMFSTPSYNLPANLAPTPVRMFTLRLFDYPIFRPIILAIIHTFVRIQGIRNRVDVNQVENFLVAASAMGYSDSHKMKGYLKLIHKHKIPTFVLFGCNDKLIPTKCFEQLKHDLGVSSDSQVKLYDSEGTLVNVPSDLHALTEVSQFLSGGHYTFQRFADQVNRDVYEFLIRRAIMIKDNIK